MDVIRFFSILSWLLLPAVMFGGYVLFGLLVRAGVLTPFEETYFRAGHAHAGTLLLLSLLYYPSLAQTRFSGSVKTVACSLVLLGVLAVGGGFFLHMKAGEPGRSSVGVAAATVGAVLLAHAIVILAYGLASA